jgi:YebC/PmpR family DNA-binding regulatory protein
MLYRPQFTYRLRTFNNIVLAPKHRLYHIIYPLLAGHSKWANIRHQKAKTDAQKMAVFGKLSREIMMAVREGGSDPTTNLRLKFVLDKCKKTNMTKEAINKAVSSGSNNTTAAMENVTYEGSGASGVAIVVNVLTDKKARTLPELRIIFNKYQGNIGGAKVGYLFDKKGLVSFKLTGRTETQEQIEDLMLGEVLGNYEDAQDVEIILDESVPEIEETSKKKASTVKLPISSGLNNYVVNVTCEQDKVHGLQQAMSQQLQDQFGVRDITCELVTIPKEKIDIDDEQSAQMISDLLNALEDHNDVISVYHNANL